METTNQEQIQQDAPKTEQVSLTKEEYEALLANKDELGKVQDQLRASSKEAQKLNWIAQVASDNSKFIKLYRTDKRQAEEVAKHFGRDARELFEAISEEYGDSVKVSLDMEDVEQKAEAIAEKKLAEASLTQFKEKFGIEGNLEKVWKEELDGLMEGKKWTVDEVQKQSKRALKLVRDTDEFQKALEDSNSKLAGAGIAGTGRGANPKEVSMLEKMKEQEKNNSLLGRYGISKKL